MSKIFRLSTVSILIIFLVVSYAFMTRNNDINKVYKLIDEGKNKEAIQLIGNTNNVNKYSAPLFLRRILNAVEADIDLPLVYACEEDNYEVVEALLKKGADPNKYLEGSWSPIEAAFVNKNDDRFKISKLLIEHGADVNLYGSWSSALFEEASHFIFGVEDEVLSNKIVNLLLENGAKPFDEDNNSVLHFSVAGNSRLISENLIKTQLISINHINTQGQTPLMWGAEKNAIDTVKLLIEKGADKSIIDANGKTAYDYAVEGNYVEIAKMLKPENN